MDVLARDVDEERVLLTGRHRHLSGPERRAVGDVRVELHVHRPCAVAVVEHVDADLAVAVGPGRECDPSGRSEEHTSELQSPCNLVCRLLLEKQKSERTYSLTPHRAN